MILQTKIFHAKNNQLVENNKKQKTKIEEAIDKWLRKNKIEKLEQKIHNYCPSEHFDEIVIIFYKVKKN